MSGVEVAGLVLAVPGVVELCLKYGTHLVTRCKDYAHAEQQVLEAILRIENIWYTMQIQIEFLRDGWGDLPDKLQIHYNSVLAVLQGNIQAAVARIDGLIGTRGEHASLGSIKQKHGDIKKTKYASLGKKSLEDVVGELEKWQKAMDNSWFILSMVRSLVLEKSIAMAAPENSPAVAQMQNIKAAQQVTASTSSIFIHASELAEIRESWIPFSEAQVAVRRPMGQRVIVDQAPRSMTKIQVRNLARKFAGMDPAITNLLTCLGVVETQDTQGPAPSKFQFVFSIPSHSTTTIRTLRSALFEPPTTYSISDRIRLATSLARSIIFLHEARFVHKNIRPETILLFNSDVDPHDHVSTLSSRHGLGHPYLIGFEELRSEDAETALRGDGLRERNIYRHPQRQGLAPQERYAVRHDVYSLGACLLELGVWESFVAYDKVAGEALPRPGILAAYADGKPWELKRQLVERARRELPSRMGEVYAGVVVACLTCLDGDSDGFGDLAACEDEDGITVGVRYIEKVLEKLEQVVV